MLGTTLSDELMEFSALLPIETTPIGEELSAEPPIEELACVSAVDTNNFGALPNGAPEGCAGAKCSIGAAESVVDT